MRSKVFKSIVAILFIALLVIVFVIVTTRTANKTYDSRVANEKNTEVDVYKMETYARDNAAKVLDILQDKDKDALESTLLNPSNVDKLINYADWDKLDTDKMTSFGTGSYMPKPDEDGKMDVGELISLKLGKDEYVIYIQTLTSRWGKIDEGVSCIAVVNRKRFDDVDYAWEWQTDNKTLRAGKPFM